MDIEEKIKDLAEKIGHSNSSTVKRLYNELREEKEELVDVIGEEEVNKMVLLDIGIKYEINEKDIDNLIGDDTLMEEEDFEDFMDDEELDDMSEEDAEGWKDIFSSIEVKTYTTTDADGNLPLLKIFDRVKYKLRIVNPSEDPREISGVNSYGNPYDACLFDVKLVNLSDKSLFEDVYESGDKKGELIYKKGAHYTLWLDKAKGLPEFVELFRDNLGLPRPDDRPFYLRRYKKVSKKNRKYNVFEFSV